MELENTRDAEACEAAFLQGWEDPGDSEAPGEEMTPEGAGTAEAEMPAEMPAEVPVEIPAGLMGPGPDLPAGPLGDLAREARAQADLRTFRRVFPDAAGNPASIPREVWENARRTGSLTTAYAAFRAAREQTLRRNEENAARSAGSMRSAGAGTGPGDPFLEGWNE